MLVFRQRVFFYPHPRLTPLRGEGVATAEPREMESTICDINHKRGFTVFICVYLWLIKGSKLKLGLNVDATS